MKHLNFLWLCLPVMVFVSSVYAAPENKQIDDNLVTFSPELRPDNNGKYCLGVRISKDQVVTAPSCAAQVNEFLAQGQSVDVLDSSQQSIGQVKHPDIGGTIYQERLALGTWSNSGDYDNLPVSFHGALPSSATLKAHYLLQQEGGTSVVSHLVTYKGRLHNRDYQIISETPLPLGAPVEINGQLVCIMVNNIDCMRVEDRVQVQAQHSVKKRQAADDGSCDQIAGEICTGFYAAACVGGVGSGSCRQQGQDCTLTFTSSNVGSITCGECAYSWVSGGISTAAASLDNCLSSNSGSAATAAATSSIFIFTLLASFL